MSEDVCIVDPICFLKGVYNARKVSAFVTRTQASQVDWVIIVNSDELVFPPFLR